MCVHVNRRVFLIQLEHVPLISDSEFLLRAIRICVTVALFLNHSYGSPNLVKTFRTRCLLRKEVQMPKLVDCSSTFPQAMENIWREAST